MELIKIFFTVFVVFVAIDALWLGIIARKLYKDKLGHLMADKVNWVAAIVFYLIFIVGIIYFVINPAIIEGSAAKALFSGLLYGFVTYSTYDLTNLATLKDWPLSIVFIDIAWGASLGGITSIISFFILS